MFVRPGFSRACEHWVGPETIQFHWTGVSGSSSLKQTEARYWLPTSATAWAWGVSHSLPGFFIFLNLTFTWFKTAWMTPLPNGKNSLLPKNLVKIALCCSREWEMLKAGKWGASFVIPPSTMIYLTALSSFLILYLDLKSLWMPAKYCFAKFKFHLYQAHYDILQKRSAFLLFVCFLFYFERNGELF